MKIAYCLNSIRYLGGIQRVTIVKANALAEVPGNEVYILVTDNKNGILVHPLSPKVHLIDLDVNYYLDDWKSKWNILKGIFIKRHKHKKKLAQALHKINPDIIISEYDSDHYRKLDKNKRATFHKKLSTASCTLNLRADSGLYRRLLRLSL